MLDKIQDDALQLPVVEDAPLRESAPVNATRIAARPSYIYTANYLNPRIGVQIIRDFTITINPYFDDYIATCSFLPTSAVAHGPGGAMDGLLSVLISRFLRFTIVKHDLAPDLYDEYRALAQHFAFR